jgi:hypothetical protein
MPSTYKIFRTAVNNIILLRYSRKVPAILTDFNKTWISRQIFIEIPVIKFHENYSNRSRADTWGITDRHTDRRTNMTKVIGAFRYLYERAKKYLSMMTHAVS